MRAIASTRVRVTDAESELPSNMIEKTVAFDEFVGNTKPLKVF